MPRLALGLLLIRVAATAACSSRVPGPGSPAPAPAPSPDRNLTRGSLQSTVADATTGSRTFEPLMP